MPRRSQWRLIALCAGHGRAADRNADLDRRRCDAHAPRGVRRGCVGLEDADRKGLRGSAPLKTGQIV